ncbi:hypothetical protein JRC04_07155 [Mycolicibacterium sp. S2-37]|uniref:hypothetical protein n=1 Tax=Mycolicibacterium sp. S2-37 TaxID=2810297 RepID=UPI001A9524A6|nr:hypothetical protein [Mycolicibacterium sp. S2-37]MBO0677239.1 hypothetical protein [Mycolicibacterium sp. S2-37]
MSTPKRSSYVGRRRAEDLPVRRWLQLGAASAGMGAALIGWSLVGSEVGVAGADSGVESSSAGPAATPAKGVDSGSTAASPSARAGTAASREDDAGTPSTTSRTVNRTRAADDAEAPKRVASRSDRVAITVDTRVPSRAATPASKPVGAAQNATPAVALAKPSAPTTTSGELAEILQDPSTQFLGGGGAGPLPVVTAGKGDALGAAGKFLGSLVKETLKRKIANPVQRLDEPNQKQKSLIDIIADAIKKAPPPKPLVPGIPSEYLKRPLGIFPGGGIDPFGRPIR